MRDKRLFFIFIILLSSFCFFSCNNVEYKGSEIIIEEVVPSNENSEANSNKNISIKSSLNVAKYLLRMIPADVNTNAVVFGDTRQSSVFVNGKTYASFKEVSPENIQNIGYVSQGSWLFTIIALDSNDEEVYTFGGKEGIDPDYSSIDYSFGELVYINSDSARIIIDLEEATGTGYTGSILLNDYKFCVVGSLDKYGIEEKNGILIRVMLESLNGAYLQSKTIDIDKSNIYALNKEDGSVDLSIALIKNFEVANQIPNGIYSVKVIMYEHDGTSWVEAAGVTYSITAIRDSNTIIKTGVSSEIDLVPFDYVDVGMGESGIIIDSGSSSSVSVNAYVVSKTTETLVESNVKINNTVRFKPTVKDGPSTITNYKWFIDGVEQLGSAIDTNGYLSFQPSTAKTYTITYMFLDGTNYNTISGNYYLTVVSGT